MTVNLSHDATRKRLAEAISLEVDQACIDIYDDGARTHLGASEIGDPCARRLWYSFRWADKEKFDGRMMRLFNRGHQTEPRVVEWLRKIGFQVWDKTEDGNQIRIIGESGHFGGSCDGVLQAPARFDIPGYGLFECKTSRTGGPFNELRPKGVQFAKPKHWRQMCVYGYKLGLDWALYACINKNDDDLYIEIVKLDHGLGREMVNKGDNIALSDAMPPRLCANTAYMEAKICPFVGQCFHDKPALKSCRSCRNVVPISGKQWFCKMNNSVIPPEFVPQGCNAWDSI